MLRNLRIALLLCMFCVAACGNADKSGKNESATDACRRVLAKMKQCKGEIVSTAVAAFEREDQPQEVREAMLGALEEMTNTDPAEVCSRAGEAEQAADAARCPTDSCRQFADCLINSPGGDPDTATSP